MNISKSTARAAFIILGIFVVLWQLDGVASRIQNASTTRFVGSFPSNLQAIVSVVKNTRSNLVIVADYCAYGYLSQPAWFEQYRDAILSLPTKNHSVQIEMYLYDPATAAATMADQFPDWETIKTSQTFKDYFEYYKADPSRRKPQNRDEFIKLMQTEHDRCIQELESKDFKDIAVKRTINRPLPIFIWLRDNQEAILSVDNLGQNGSREASLLTNDPNLILTLKEIAYRVRSGQ